MIGRVTDTMKYNMIVQGIVANQRESAKLTEQLATQKIINRPSDNPTATSDVLDYRTIRTSMEHYENNIGSANVWLSLSNINLTGLIDIVNQAKSIADSESGYLASYETRSTSSSVLGTHLAEVISLLNSQNGDNYLFSGSATNVQPFSTSYSSASVDAATAAQTNVFDGTVTSSGTYSGTDNKTYVLKITGGTVTAANYAVSSDGGKTWAATGTVNLSVPASVALGDGVALDFTAGTQIAANDFFEVKTYASGYYRGDDNPLETLISKNFTMEYNISGAKAFTGQFAFANFSGAVVLKGSEENQAGGAAITAGTLWSAIDGANVQNGTQIEISGLDHEGNTVGPTQFTVLNAATGTVGDLLASIQTAYGASATVSMDASGRITLTDNTTGASRMTMNLNVTNPAGSSLNFGAVASTLDDALTLKRGPTTADWAITGFSSKLSSATIVGVPTSDSITIRVNNGATTSDIAVSLTGEWNQNDTINLSLASGVSKMTTTFQGSGSVDLLSTLYALNDALLLPESEQEAAVQLIAAQVDNLANARTQLYRYSSQASARLNSLEMVGKNNDSFYLEISNKLTDTEQADIAELIMAYQMKQISLQASYNMASKIGEMTILNYL